jgi:Bacterial regulatory protein, Fis family
MKLTELAKVLGLHRNTLRRRLKEAGMSREFSTITNANLDELLRAYKQRRPESGLRYAIGYLRTRGLKVQHKRVMMSLKRIDGLGRILQHRQVTQRRTYTAKRPNAIWHVDGHHKLIRWGIVIHGFIDGYCRTVSLHCDQTFDFSNLTDYCPSCELKQPRYHCPGAFASWNRRIWTSISIARRSWK